MNLADVMDELSTALNVIEGLRPFPYWAENVAPPAAIVGWPDPVDYDQTMGRGSDMLTMPVVVLVGRLDARSSRNLLASYLDGAGDRSVKAALDGGTYTSCDSVTVNSATVNSVSLAGVEYLGAEFQVQIIGNGA